MLSRPVSYWFSAGTYTGEIETYLDGSPVERAVLGSLIFAGLFVLLRRRANWSAIFGESAAVWIFYAFALLSVAWSPYPPVTLKRIIRELGTIVMILVVLTETNQLDAVKRVFVRCALVLVPLSMLFIKYYPAIGRNYHRWTHQVQYNGVTTNKNSLGVIAMLGGLFLLWHIAEQKKGVTRWQQFVSVWPEACVIGLCVWILYIANSATALACFLLGVVLFLTGRTVFNGASVKATVGVTALVGLGALMGLLMSDLRGFVAGNLGRDSTLTTRTEIWEAALSLPTNPIVGAGFASVWLTPEGWALRERIGGLAHAHNGYLEAYLNGGAIGVTLLVAVLFTATLQAGRHLAARTRAGAFYVACVVAGLVYNISEVTFSNGNAVGLLLWLIAMSGPHALLVRGSVGQLEQSQDGDQRIRPGRRRLKFPRRSTGPGARSAVA